MNKLEFYNKYTSLSNEIKKVIVGQDEIIEFLLMAMFCDSHVICTGVPGLGKTLLISTLGKALGLDFKRVQFTPDLMPNDIVGFEILENDREGGAKKIKVMKGPVFTQILLADEINRTSPKTQSALLQAMQEKEVSIGQETFKLPHPFFVFATQNPIEQEGTYPLPEAQLDRFMFHLTLDYTRYQDEVKMVKQTVSEKPFTVNQIISQEVLLEMQRFLADIPISDALIEKAVDMIVATRPTSDKAHKLTKKYVHFGSGPRSAQNLVKAARCHALLRQKPTPDYEDLKACLFPILEHRIIFNYEAINDQMTKKQFVDELLSSF